MIHFIVTPSHSYKKYQNLFEQQEHVLEYFDELSNEAKEDFVSHLESVDLKELSSLFKTHHRLPFFADSFFFLFFFFLEVLSQSRDAIQPWEEVTKLSKKEHDECWDVGIDLIRKGEVCAFLMAGGQGTRLGSEHPK